MLLCHQHPLIHEIFIGTKTGELSRFNIEEIDVLG